MKKKIIVFTILSIVALFLLTGCDVSKYFAVNMSDMQQVTEDVGESVEEEKEITEEMGEEVPEETETTQAANKEKNGSPFSFAKDTANVIGDSVLGFGESLGNLVPTNS